MTRRNTTFGGGEPTWANARVGNNGSLGYWDYAKGFSQAAILLIDEVLHNQSLKYSVDEFVYPVCFNMRHSVELRLKAAISELILLGRYRKHHIEFDLKGSHDIGSIWQFFDEGSRSIDDRYIAINGRLGTKILDLAEMDATGQTFRYPVDKASQKHLVDVAIINFVNLKTSFTELEAALDELHLLNKYLCDEYSYNTITKSLSRKNIFDIASQLPNRSQWGEESFKTTKSDIKDQFNIGSKEFGQSINIIQNHFEIAPLIGLSESLLGIVKLDIMEFMEHWLKLNDLPYDNNCIDLKASVWVSEVTLDSIVSDSKAREEVWENIKPQLTPQILAGLSALFYFAYRLDFSEHYIDIYDNHLQEAKVAFEWSEDEVRSQFMHIFDKTNLLDNILRSLYFLKKAEMAEVLVSVHNLERKFSWLDNARTGALFKKPEYCGYEI